MLLPLGAERPELALLWLSRSSRDRYRHTNVSVGAGTQGAQYQTLPAGSVPGLLVASLPPPVLPRAYPNPIPSPAL